MDKRVNIFTKIKNVFVQFAYIVREKPEPEIEFLEDGFVIHYPWLLGPKKRTVLWGQLQEIYFETRDFEHYRFIFKLINEKTVIVLSMTKGWDRLCEEVPSRLQYFNMRNFMMVQTRYEYLEHAVRCWQKDAMVFDLDYFD